MGDRWAPAMTWDVGATFDGTLAKNGPIVVFWGQDHPILTNHELPDPPVPRRTWWQRLRRYRAWKVEIRLQPPPGEDLHAWGRRIADRLGIAHSDGPRRPTDQAIYLPCSTVAPTAADALSAATHVFHRLDGFTVAAMQVRVDAMREPAVEAA